MVGPVPRRDEDDVAALGVLRTERGIRQLRSRQHHTAFESEVAERELATMRIAWRRDLCIEHDGKKSDGHDAADQAGFHHWRGHYPKPLDPSSQSLRRRDGPLHPDDVVP